MPFGRRAFGSTGRKIHTHTHTHTETAVDCYPASPLYSEQSGYDKRELENGSRNVRAKGMLEVLAEEQYPVYKL